MAIQLNIGEARKRWYELVQRAIAGEEVVIARRGKPVVELRAHAPGDPHRQAPPSART